MKKTFYLTKKVMQGLLTGIVPILMVFIFGMESKISRTFLQQDIPVTNKQVEVEDNSQWSEPERIPIDLDDRIPTEPDIVAVDDKLYMVFQTYKNGYIAPHDVWMISLRGGEWSTPDRIAKTSWTTNGSRIAVADGDDGQMLHLIWWDKPAEQEYSHENLPFSGAVSEIWYANKDRGGWSAPDKLFEGNHFTPAVFLPVISESDGRMFGMFRAGIDDIADGRPSVFLLRIDGDSRAMSRPIIAGGGSETQLALMDDRKLLFAYRGAKFQWAKEHFKSDLRGIFLKRSQDGGETWSEPYVIDRGEFAHSSTANPGLIIDGKEKAHLFWRQDTTGDDKPDNLAHAWSEDGEIWSDLVLLEDALQKNKGAIRYYDAAATPQGHVHVVYVLSREDGDSGSRIYHTIWDETAWNTPEPVFDIAEVGRPVLAFDDATSRLHLVFRAVDEPVSSRTGLLDLYDVYDNTVIPKNYSTDLVTAWEWEQVAAWKWYHATFGDLEN
jgi:hypothetical protein